MDAREYLDRLKKEFEVKSDAELTVILDVTPAAMAKWIARNKIPDKIINKRHNVSDIKSNTIIRVPKLSAKVSAGYNVQSIDSIEQIGELILDISIFKTQPPKKLFSMQVDGYSMIPMILPDSWVIFDDDKQFKGDGLYIINWDDCLMVKQISATPKKNTVQIISANKDYQSWEVDLSDTQCSFMIFGKVIRAIL